ncbi:MAG: tetratricopeptide repeat protein [Pontiella sp.]
MNVFTRYIIMLALSVPAVQAQENESEEKAKSGLQIETRTDEERCQFLLEVAEAYFKEDDFNSAISAYERILKIDPEHQQARYVIGHVYISAKKYEKAEVQLLALVNDFPEDFKLKNNLAWLYATAEDPHFRDGEKAVKVAQEAMILAPNDHHVWSTLSEAYYVSGDYEKAYRAITHMASLAARYGTGITKEAVEDYNEQIRKCKRAWDTQKMLTGEDE